MSIEVQDIGRSDYREAWDYQDELFKRIVDIKLANRNREVESPRPGFFVFTEHDHVYTLGKSGDLSNLLLSEEQLEKKGISFFKSNRGGDITYHGPGQIVGYPIIDLESYKPDIRWYMRSLEEVIVRTLAEYGMKGTRSEGETGVWLDVGTPFARKICALGVRTSRWVTMHGFALNVNTDLGFFDHIIPCGIRGKAVTSMHAELGTELDTEIVKDQILKYFSEVFSTEMV
jgi:lipoyl(octanoyl) transferase